MPETSTTSQTPTTTIPKITTSNVNKVGQSALQDKNIPAPLSRLIAAINPTFSIETGKVKGIGPQPVDKDPIAAVDPQSPNQILVTQPDEFRKDPVQTSGHEFVHLVQHNLTPAQRAAIPPDVGNPAVVTQDGYLEKQRKAGKTILQLPTEQQSYLTQFYISKQEAFNKGYITKKEMAEVEKTYGPWIKDWNDVKLSTVKGTDPSSKTLETTPRAPLPPANYQQSTIQFDTTSTSTVPVTTSSKDRTRFEQQTADMGQLIKDSNTVPTGEWNSAERAKQDNAKYGVANFRPGTSSQQKDLEKAKHPLITNLEDEKKDQKFGHGFDSGGDTKQARDYRQQQIKNRISAVENPAYKNPFAFTHPLDRQAATYAKAQRIIKNPHFAALPSDKKAVILSNYYDKYVVPIYKNSKIEPPHKDAWVSQVQKGFFKVSDFYEYSGATNKDAFSDLSSTVAHAQASAVETAGHIGHFILMAGVKTDRKILGLTNFFPGSALHSWAEGEADHDARVAEPALKLSQDVIDRPTFWLDTHPTRSYSEKAGSFVGEQLVQLPLYSTIEAPLGLLGKTITSTGNVGRAANFTRRLATSKIGQFAGKRMAEAASAYVGDAFSETPQGDRALDMAVFMGLGTAGDIYKGLVKPIARAAMKKVVATNVAIGGKVLHETIADQAAFELEHNIIGTDAVGDPIIHDPKINTKEEFAQKMQQAQQADPVKHSMVTAEKISQNAMAHQLYGKPLNQLSKLQRRKVRVELAHMTSEAVTEIPIHVPEVAQHEIETKLSEDARENPELAATFAGLEAKYGAKIVDSVAHTEKESIAVENGIISTQGATKRVGRNEDVLAAKNNELGGAGKSSKEATPISLRSPAELAEFKPAEVKRTREQGFFGDFGDTGNTRYNSGDQGYNVKFQSPVDKALYRLNSNTEKARAARPDLMKRLKAYFGDTKTQQEIMQMASAVKEQLDAEVKSRRPLYNSDPVKHAEINFPVMHKYEESVKSPAKTVKKAEENLTASYVSFRQNMRANFVNPFQSKAQQANKSLDKFLDGLDDKEFVQEISDQMGNSIHFEKPYDMLLWGLHHADYMPNPIVKRIKSVLTDQDPNATYAELKEEGKRLAYHIDLLAMSGRLDTEGNVFRSTVTSSFSGRTRWQRELEKEVSLGEIENYKNSMAPYVKNFADAYDAGLKELAKIQKLRRASKTDADTIAAHEKIKNLLENAEKKPKKK